MRMPAKLATAALAALGRLASIGLVFSCALFGVFVFAEASAQAFIPYKYEGQITRIPAEGPHKEAIPQPGLLGSPSLATEPGVLFIADGAGRVDSFEASSGAFLSQPTLPGITFGEGAGERQEYSQTGTGVEVFGPGLCGSLECSVLQTEWTGADTPNESFTSEKGAGSGAVVSVAVDRSTAVTDWARGDVLVATNDAFGNPNPSLNAGLNVVDVFKPEAGGGEKYVTQLTGIAPGEPFQGPTVVAVSGFNGDVLVANDLERVVDVFEPAGVGEYAFVRQLVSAHLENVEHITVDASTGEVYLGGASDVDNLFEGNDERAVEAFGATGEHLQEITGSETPAGGFSQMTSLAVDSQSHRLFVADGGAAEAIGSQVVFRVSEFGGKPVPDVNTGSVSNVHYDQVAHTWRLTFHGTVNPDDAGGTTCQFAWGSTPSLGHVAPCTQDVPNGSSALPVEAGVEDLQPGTTYYYRLQASNQNGENEGEEAQNAQFTTGGPGVGEEFASDLTSGSVTLGAEIDPNNAPTTYYFQYGTSAAYGESVPLPPGVALGSGEGDVGVSVHLQGLTAGTVYHYRVVAVSETGGEVVTADGGDQTFTTQVAGGGSSLPDGRAWEMVSPPDKHGALILPILEAEGVIQASVTGDGLTYVTSSPTEAEPLGYTNSLQVLSLRGPGGWSSRDITIPHEKATGQAVGVGQEYRFFSEDLSLAVVQPFGNFDPSLSLEASEQTPYLRTNYLDGDVNDPCVESCYRPLVTGKPGFANVPEGTIFGESNETSSGGSKNCPPLLICGPEFIGATPDLQHIFIGSPVSLTAGKGGGVYEWDAGKLRASSTGEVPRQRVLESEDGSWTYFFSSQVLASGALTGQPNLYVRHGSVTKLVAVLSPEDEEDHSSTGYLAHIPMRVSPDGHWLAFMSLSKLTGYDNRDAVSGKPDEEVYLYDAEANGGEGSVVCASCDPSGARPVGVEYKDLNRKLVGGDRVWPGSIWIAANIPGWTPLTATESLYQSRYLSDSGRLFFNSGDALVPQDVNGTQDVYQYEPPGIGDCTTSSATFSVRSGGCVGLISSGASAEESAFLDASGNGGDVFFLTAAKLSSQDYDTALDVYDAHECTSAAPCYPPAAVASPACDTEASCRAAPTPQPGIFGSPSSSTFSGAGNLTQAVAPPVVVTKSLTRAQKLQRALRICHAKKSKGRRAMCERNAKTKYAARHSSKTAPKKKKGRG